MNEELYKKFLNYLIGKIDGLWYRSYNPSRYCGFDENSTLYSWGYTRQTMDEDDREEYGLESYKELVEDIVKYLKVVNN